MIMKVQTTDEIVATIKNDNDRICDVFTYISIMSTQLNSIIEVMTDFNDLDRNSDTFYDLLCIANDLAYQMKEYVIGCERACDVKKTIC